MSDIGKNIKKRRNEIKLTMKELAEKVGVSVSTINRYENGYIDSMQAETFINIAKILKIEPEKLFGEYG